jgi:hypothetical protein
MLTTAPNSATVADAPIGERALEPTKTKLHESAGDELTRKIAEAAYYIAERRGFEPGHEVDDWLQAEGEIFEQFAARTAC